EHLELERILIPFLRDRTNSENIVSSKKINDSTPPKSWPFQRALDDFLRKYNPRLVTICDFFVWRIHNSICFFVAMDTYSKETPQFYNKFTRSSKNGFLVLRVFIMDQPGPPLCRVREIFDFQIPYNSSEKVSVLYFTHGLWKIRLGLENTSSTIDNICKEIQRQ
ncbi:13945_t:CDS:2, partial [Gigaspora margarita]